MRRSPSSSHIPAGCSPCPPWAPSTDSSFPVCIPGSFPCPAVCSRCPSVVPGGSKAPSQELLVAPPDSVVGMEGLEPQESRYQPPIWLLPGSWEPNPANPTLPRAGGAARSSLRCLRLRRGPVPSFPFGKEQTRNAAHSAPGNDSQGLKPRLGLGGSPPRPSWGSARGSPCTSHPAAGVRGASPRATSPSLPGLQAPSSSGFFPLSLLFPALCFPGSLSHGGEALTDTQTSKTRGDETPGIIKLH